MILLPTFASYEEHHGPEPNNIRRWYRLSRIPRATRLTRPIDASSLKSALKKTVNELEKFNEEHPYPPIRRSGRTNLYQGSYNYNYRKGKRRQEEERKTTQHSSSFN